MPQFVVCVEAVGASASVPPCSDVGGVFFHPVVMEFPAPGAVSYDQAAELFAFGFGGVVSIWLVGLAIGSVVRLVRRGS